MMEVFSLLSLIAVIAMLRKIVETLPSMLACALRWRENNNLESSAKMSGNRNLIALVLIFPFCISLVKYRIMPYRFMSGMSEELQLGTTLLIILSYHLFRIFTTRVFTPNRHSKTAYYTADKCAKTFFVLLVLAVLVTGGILSYFNAPPAAIRNTIVWISAAIYLLFLTRKFQIFTSYCSVFSAFLYLCALEIIPTGTLVVSAIIF